MNRRDKQIMLGTWQADTSDTATEFPSTPYPLRFVPEINYHRNKIFAWKYLIDTDVITVQDLGQQLIVGIDTMELGVEYIH